MKVNSLCVLTVMAAATMLGACSPIVVPQFTSCEEWVAAGETPPPGFLCADCSVEAGGKDKGSSGSSCGFEVKVSCTSPEGSAPFAGSAIISDIGDLGGAPVDGGNVTSAEVFLTQAWVDVDGDGFASNENDETSTDFEDSDDVLFCSSPMLSNTAFISGGGSTKNEIKCAVALEGSGKGKAEYKFEAEWKYDSAKNDCM